MNEVLDGQPALFDTFNILDGPTDIKERKNIHPPQEGSQYPFVGDLLLPELVEWPLIRRQKDINERHTI